MSRRVSRREFLESAAVASAASLVPQTPGFGRAIFLKPPSSERRSLPTLQEFGYGDVSLDSPIHERQLEETHAVLPCCLDEIYLRHISTGDLAGMRDGERRRYRLATSGIPLRTPYDWRSWKDDLPC